MESREHPRIMSGLDVFDIEGHKIGTVTHLHETGSPADPTLDDVFEVKTGLFGLGKHYYVPFRAVKDISASGVFLKRSRLDSDALGWAAKPHAGGP
jgi:ribosomal 30S subunit maturation factor RimM